MTIPIPIYPLEFSGLLTLAIVLVLGIALVFYMAGASHRASS